MTEFAWDPDSYLQLMAQEVPDYARLQDELVAATGGCHARAILDLGIGSGLTAARVLDAYPGATLVGVDANTDMLAAAAHSLDPRRTTLHHARLEEALPEGPFELVTSMLAVHHLDGAGKAELFQRVAGVMSSQGRFVLADLVVPDDPEDVVTPIDGVEDTPSSLDDQLAWMAAAGLQPVVSWRHRDLAVVTSTRSW